MSMSLFLAIVALIVIFAIVTTGAFAIYMHFYTKFILKKQTAMFADLTEEDEKDLDGHYGENPDAGFFTPRS